MQFVVVFVVVVCQKRIVRVIMHYKNEMHNYIFNKQLTCAFVGDHEIFVKFVLQYPCLGVISERSSSTKLKLNESTKRNPWLSLRDTSPWRANNSDGKVSKNLSDN